MSEWGGWSWRTADAAQGIAGGSSRDPWVHFCSFYPFSGIWRRPFRMRMFQGSIRFQRHVQQHLMIECFGGPTGKNVAPTEIHRMAGASGTGVVRQWMVLGKTVGSRCVAALIGVGYNRLHSAYHGNVDMRHNCFGFAPWQSFIASSLGFILSMSQWHSRAIFLGVIHLDYLR